MSELMDQAVIGMPYDMAMEGEVARRQFYCRAQSVLAEAQALREEVAALRARVVVPERRDPPFGGLGSHARDWNACLDELARLNGKTVSEELLRRIDESMRDYLGEDDPLRLEFSALLDEGKEDADA